MSRLTPLSAVLLLLAACSLNPFSKNAPVSEPQLQSVSLTLSSTKPAETVSLSDKIAPPEQAPVAEQEVLPPSVWEHFRQHSKLDLSLDNAAIAAERRFYQNNPAYLERTLTRAEPYLYYIQTEIERRDMPSELLLLPIIESAYDPFAYSPGRAAGIWQFIPGTARNFGLKQTWWYEGRRDIVASTDAALNYMEILQKHFHGDWLLTLAAYNAGEGTVLRAIAANKRQGKPTDFWSLNLRKQTRDYVPRLIAISQVFMYPERYNVTLRDIPFEPYFATVDIKAQLDLAQASRMAGVSMDEFYKLNPAFNRWATDPAGPHRLLVPVAQAEQFQLELDNMPVAQRVQWDRYTVRSGDTVGGIARKFHITPELLKSTNKMSSNNLRAGATLLIPQSRQPQTHYALSADQRLEAKQNRPVSGKQKVMHTVGAGESLWSISRQYGVDMKQLAGWNNMVPRDSLTQGRQLVVWTGKAPTQNTQAAEQNNRTRKVQYRARSGDSYAGIANKFNVSLNEIKRWNNLNLKKHLQPGDLLTLHVDVTKAP